jgi:hypothetical protein
MTDTATIVEPATRQPRDTKRPGVEDAPKTIIIDGDGDTGTDAVDPLKAAVEDARKKAEDSAQAKVDAARREAADATARAEKAERTAAAAVTTQVGDREQAIINHIAASTAEKNSAIAELRAATEKGDLDAQMAAQEKLAEAVAELKQANAAKTHFETVVKPQLAADPNSRASTTQEPGAQQRYAPEAQRWIDAHPQFNTDDDYKADALAAHQLALDKGIQANTPAYFDFLNARMEKLYGADHGHDGTRREATVTTDTNLTRQPRQSRTSTAAPRGDRDDPGGRSGNVGAGRVGTVRTNLGPVEVTQVGADGKPLQIAFRDPMVRAEFEKGASACNMSLPEYTLSQIEIAQQGIRFDHEGVYE